MAGLTFIKKHIARMADVLDQDYETVEEAAKAALDVALDIIKERAKFTVVGQLRYTTDHRTLNGNDPEADKISLGWYATEKQAIDDALKLAYSMQTHEEFRAWVLPIFNDTPNAYYVSRKKAMKQADISDGSYRERELARREQWIAEHPGEPLPLDWTVSVAAHAETQECKACDGIGRIPNDEMPRRADLPRVWDREGGAPND